MKILKHPLQTLISEFPNSGKVLDVGSLNYTQYKRMVASHPGVAHYGIDYVDNTEVMPDGYTFKRTDLNTQPIPFEDDYFDLIVASHVIEHLNDPLNFYKECIRVLKPGGKFYLEAPSERSLMIKGMDFAYDKFYSLSYYDDPTHTMRPWSPQAFFRMARYYGSTPLKVDHIQNSLIRMLSPLLIPFAKITRNGDLLEKTVWWAKGWAAYMIATKHKKGSPDFHYYIPNRKEMPDN